MTGTYRFNTGFCGLTYMPAEFQKATSYPLISLKKTFCFLDHIIIVSKGSEEDHFKLVTNCLKKLDADNLRIILTKCRFAMEEILWLVYGTTLPSLHFHPPIHLENCVFFSARYIILVNFLTYLNSATL